MIVTEDHGTWSTVAEAAEHHGVQERTIRAWIKRHHLPTVRLYGLVHVSDDALAACEKARRDTPQYRSRGVSR